MDPAPAIGIGAGFGVVIAVNVLEGGNPMSLLLLPPILLVFGTTILVTMAGGTMKDAKTAAASIKRAFTGKAESAEDLIPAVVDLAERARREGLLALEDAVKGVDDEFLRRGRHDGHRRHRPRGAARHPRVRGLRQASWRTSRPRSSSPTPAPTRRPSASSAPSWASCTCSRTSPAPEELGHLIAGAFVATLWGVTSANVHLPAARQPPQAPRRARGRAHGGHHRGRRRHPGRLEPAHRRPEAALAARRPAAVKSRRPDMGHKQT